MESIQVFAFQEALRRSMGDVEFLKMMLDEFQVLIPEVVARLENACREADMATVGKDAHQLKGAAANLSAKALAAAAMSLEQIGKEEKPDECAQALAELKQAAEIFRQHIATINWADATPDSRQHS